MGVRIGVAGTGRLGREHVRVLSAMDGVDFVGCHDAHPGRAREVAAANGATPFESLEAMFAAVDSVTVVVPTTDHATVALAAIDAGLDVFVEKPMAKTVVEAESMLERASARGKILQVGHVERFNRAVRAVANDVHSPSFIEVHRLAPFTIRGTDVSVVGDLMIHDLDLLGYFLREWPVDIRAKGASVLTNGYDIVNVRLEYPSGCVANVTASRVTATPMRKMRIFSADAYLSIDLLKGVATRYRKTAQFDGNVDTLRAGAEGHERLGLADFVEIETISPEATEPLGLELAAFVRSITTREAPPVSGEDGLRAVRLATEILARTDAARA